MHYGKKWKRSSELLPVRLFFHVHDWGWAGSSTGHRNNREDGKSVTEAGQSYKSPLLFFSYCLELKDIANGKILQIQYIS